MKSKIVRLVAVNLTVLVVIVGLLFVGAELYLRAKKSFNVQTVTAVGLPIYKKSEALAWEHKAETSVPDYPAGSGETLAINCRGHRSEQCREPGPIDSVLMLGDSFTFGINVKQRAIFPNLLDEKLGINTEVRNAGTIGYTIDQYAAYIYRAITEAEQSGATKPSLVVVNLFVGNDITELRRHTVLAEDLEVPTHVKDNEVFVGDDGTLESYTTSEPHSFALYKLAQLWEAFLLKTGVKKIEKPTLTWPVFLAKDNVAQDSNLEEYWRTAEQVLLGLNQFLIEHQTKFLVVIVPMDVQVSHLYWDKYPGMPFDEEAFTARRPQSRLTYFLSGLKVPTVDLLLEFVKDEYPENLYFKESDTHFTEYGHQRTAEILEPVIRAMLE